LPKLFYTYVLKPIGQVIQKVAEWTYKYILIPTGDAIAAVAKTIADVAKYIFGTLPTQVDAHVLKSIGKGVAIGAHAG